MTTGIEARIENGVGWITLNRPERLNALDVPARVALAGRLEELSADETVRAIVLRGAGGNFCSGADVSGFGEESLASSRRRMRRGGHRIIEAITRAEKPVIAAVEGHVIGMGWAMALASDVVIASATARFHAPFARLGLIPDLGAAHHLARALGPYRAKDILFSGRAVGADEAEALGLVSVVVAAEAFDAAVAERTAALAAGPTFTLARIKQMVDSAVAPTLDAALEYERLVAPQLRFTHDFREGTAAYREKRDPDFRGE